MVVGEVVVDVDAFMVEELTVGNHGDVAEVLAEAPCDKVGVDPLGILERVGFRLEERWVLAEDELESLELQLELGLSLSRLADGYWVLE